MAHVRVRVLTLGLALLWCGLAAGQTQGGHSPGQALRHDQYSREGAHEAIRRYNEHIDKCNRVIEAQEAGLPSAGVGNTEVESLRRQLEDSRTECDAASRERDNLQAELKQTSAT